MSGIRTIDDLRDRCFVDDITGCWHWRGATTCGKYPASWLPAIARRVTLGHVICFLRTGQLPDKGTFWHCTCETKSCANPEHRMAGTRSEQMKAAKIVKSPLVRARMAQVQRDRSVLTDQGVAAIRSSGEPLRVVAERYGISMSHASGIRRGEQRASISAPGSSVFNWSGA